MLFLSLPKLADQSDGLLHGHSNYRVSITILRSSQRFFRIVIGMDCFHSLVASVLNRSELGIKNEVALWQLLLPNSTFVALKSERFKNYFNNELVKAATDACRKIFCPGINYKKAGVILTDISPATAVQMAMPFYDTIDRSKHSRLMTAMDKINEIQGRRTLVVASRGFDPIKMNRQHLSKEFTTNLDDIIRVKTDR